MCIRDSGNTGDCCANTDPMREPASHTRCSHPCPAYRAYKRTGMLDGLTDCRNPAARTIAQRLSKLCVPIGQLEPIEQREPTAEYAKNAAGGSTEDFVMPCTNSPMVCNSTPSEHADSELTILPSNSDSHKIATRREWHVHSTQPAQYAYCLLYTSRSV